MGKLFFVGCPECYYILTHGNTIDRNAPLGCSRCGRSLLELLTIDSEYDRVVFIQLEGEEEDD